MPFLKLFLAGDLCSSCRAYIAEKCRQPLASFAVTVGLVRWSCLLGAAENCLEGFEPCCACSLPLAPAEQACHMLYKSESRSAYGSGLLLGPDLARSAAVFLACEGNF